MTAPNSFPQYSQFPQQPGFPPGFQQQPQQPQYPGGYAPQPQIMQQLPHTQMPAAPLQAGSLDDFFGQPSVGGGPALKFEVGTTHVGIVSRAVTNADIQQQTIPGTNTPATYKDGRPKWVMKVPLQVQPTQENPDGQAQWYVSGGARDELVRAMAEVGAPQGPPEAGAAISVTCTGTRPAGAGMNPAKVYKVQYRRPQNAASATAPEVTAAAVAPEPTVAPPVAPEVPVAAPAAAPTATPPAAQAAQPAAPQPPADMSPAQQELLKSLGG